MPTYVMKLTAIGAAKIAAATSGGAAVSLTEMAVGDGNGNPVTPTGSENALVHEVYRVGISSLGVVSGDTSRMVAEMLIPSATGNFAIREVGVFDSTGALIAYGNFPDTWKPIPTDGSSRDMVIQATMKVGNSSVVNLVVDGNIVGASRQWVLNTITRAYILPGGTTGQVATKASNADGDIIWTDPTAALNIVVNAIKEEQTAAAGQDTFTLAVCTTVGVAVYVEGIRQHNFTVLTTTSLRLSRTLPLGTKVLFVQNEPNNALDLRKIAAGKAYFMGQFI